MQHDWDAFVSWLNASIHVSTNKVYEKYDLITLKILYYIYYLIYRMPITGNMSLLILLLLSRRSTPWN